MLNKKEMDAILTIGCNMGLLRRSAANEEYFKFSVMSELYKNVDENIAASYFSKGTEKCLEDVSRLIVDSSNPDIKIDISNLESHTREYIITTVSNILMTAFRDWELSEEGNTMKKFVNPELAKYDNPNEYFDE